MNAVIGIDVSKDKLDVICLYNDKSKYLQVNQNQSGFVQLNSWIKKHSETATVCLESTGSYSQDIASFLHQQDHVVSVVNPARIHAYGRSQLSRNKTDKADARIIADFCLTQNPDQWFPPDAAQLELQAMTRHLNNLETNRVREGNRLSSGQNSQFVEQQIKDLIVVFETQITQLKREIDRYIDDHPHLKAQKDLMVSIPGIGVLTAAKLLAEIRDIKNFDNVRQLVAFAGLNPKHRQSGSSVKGRTRISKTGSATLRSALYMPALSARQWNPVLRAFAERLQERGLPKKAVIVAIMRKLLHLIYGILRTGKAFDPAYEKQRAAA